MLSISVSDITEHADGTVSFKFSTNPQSGITPLLPAKETNQAPIYTLQGVSVAVPAKGTIYIRNGRKFMAK